MNRKHFMLLPATGLILTGFLAACGNTQAVPATSTFVPTPTVVPIHPGTIAFTLVGPGYVDDTYLINTDGTGLKRLTETNLYADAAAWSPDGNRIAYQSPQVADNPNHRSDISVMNADGSEKKQLTHGPQINGFPAWSPDGNQISYSSWLDIQKPAQIHIYVMSADGNNPRQVTNGPADDLLTQWTPDGRILFIRKEHGFNESFGDVYSIKPDGSDLVKLTNIGRVGGFALSPDGTKLAIHNLVNHTIEVLPVTESGTGAPETLVNTDFGYDFIKIAWSPDGQALAMAYYDLVEWLGYDLHVVNADGSGLTTIPNVHSAWGAAWQP